MIKVYRSAEGVWSWSCGMHKTDGECSDWHNALVASYGHAAFFHRALRPVWDVRIFDGTHELSVIGAASRVYDLDKRGKDDGRY